MSQMYDQMTKAALERLAHRDPLALSEKAGVLYNGEAECLTIPFLGQMLTVSTADYSISPPQPFWAEMVILHYLDLADGTPPTGIPIPFSQMAGGLARGSGVDRRCEEVIQRFHGLTPRMLDVACQSLGGKKQNSRADAAWCIPLLPRFPVTLQIWFADEEFPASGRLFVDASADHYLSIEDAVVVAEILLEALHERCM